MIIGICDDEAEGREQIRQVCEVVLKQMDVRQKLRCLKVHHLCCKQVRNRTS